MPIIGLTSNRAAAFPKIGTLRKGDVKPEGNRPGKDLDYFRFDSDDEQAREEFEQAYGKTPRDIRVFLPYQTTEQNLATWKEAWKAGGLLHRCDGVTCTIWRTPDGKYSQEPRPCFGDCKAVGRLSVVIPELKRLAYVTVQTTSVHDVITLQENLEAAELLRGDLRGIPFVLSRHAREISMPDGKGGRVRREKWLLSIEPAPTWVALQLTAMEQAALPGTRQRLLTVSEPPIFDVEPADEDDEGPTTVDMATGEIVPTPAAHAVRVIPRQGAALPYAAIPAGAHAPLDRQAAITKIRRLMNEYHDLTGVSSPNLAKDLTRLSDDQLVEIGRTEKQRLAGAEKARSETAPAADELVETPEAVAA